MRRSRFVSLLLCIAVFATLFSGFAASAAPLKLVRVTCPDKPANLSLDTKPQPPAVDCCPSEQPSKIVSGAPAIKSASPVVVEDPCCSELPIRGKVQIGVNEVADPCAPEVDTPEVPDETCDITYPSDAVVGEIPFNQQAYYEPGLLASGVTINAGTYWVTGLGEADNGDEFYQIVIACQLLFVPANDIVPSYQAPWSGQPLPTTDPIDQ